MVEMQDVADQLDEIEIVVRRIPYIEGSELRDELESLIDDIFQKAGEAQRLAQTILDEEAEE